MRLRFLLLWLCLAMGNGASAATLVVVVSSDRTAPYAEAAEAFISELERTGLSRYEMLQVTARELAGAGPLTPRLYVALGTEAVVTMLKAESRVPVLGTLLPRSSFEHAMQASGRKPSTQFSALYLDQPLSRQLELIRLALPTASRVGVLWGPDSQVLSSQLKALSGSTSLTLNEATVGAQEPVFGGLKRVLEEADVMLAVADPQVYNTNSVQNILLAAFRARVPMVAFSPAYVRAGALMAVYATPAQIGQQAATIARGVLQGKELSATPLFSQDFSVSVNEHVARSLGLTLDADTLRTRLRRKEGSP